MNSQIESQELTNKQPVASQAIFMVKELTLKWSFAYDDIDFSNVVEAFKAGTHLSNNGSLILRLTSSERKI